MKRRSGSIERKTFIGYGVHGFIGSSQKEGRRERRSRGGSSGKGNERVNDRCDFRGS